MAQGQGRSSGQGVKLLYIRDYLYSQTCQEAGKGVSAKDISAFLASKGIKASVKRFTMIYCVSRSTSISLLNTTLTSIDISSQSHSLSRMNCGLWWTVFSPQSL